MGRSFYLLLVALFFSANGCGSDQSADSESGTQTESAGNSAGGAIGMAGASDAPTSTGGTSFATGGAAFTDVGGTGAAGVGGRINTGGAKSSGGSGGRGGSTGGRTGTGGTSSRGGSATTGGRTAVSTGGRTAVSTGGRTGTGGSGGQTASGGTSSAGGGACGNDVVDDGEACDGADLGGYTCANLGFSGGALACSDKCAFDTSGCAASKNILTNGGFEYGTPCFNYWEWAEPTGNYDFFLSDDAYEGSYALEIECVGSQCGDGRRAALFSTPIEGPANQDYRLTAQAKCTGSGDIYFANAGDSTVSLTCDDEWHEVVAEIATTGDNFFFYLRNTGTGRVLFDDLVLTYADGTAPNPPLLHAGEREVTVDGQRVLVDGKPYFARGFFNVPYSSLETVKDLGANTIVELTDGDTSGCYANQEVHFFDRAYELGLNLLPTSTMTARLDLPSIFPGVMERYSRHLANIGWFLADEPDMPEEAEMPWMTVSPEVLTAEYEQIKTASSLPVMVDLQRSWDTVDINAPFVGAMDIWMAEPYGGTDNDFWGIGNAVDNFNSLDRKPIWLAQDGISPATLIVPKSYWAIVQGVTGLVFFTWVASDSYAFEGNEERLAAVRQLFGEIAQLEDIIFGGEDITSEVSGYEEVGVMGRSMPDRNVVIAARATDTNGRVTFRHASLAADQSVEVLFEDRTLTASDGSFTDSFAGKSRHVYSW